MQRDALNRKTRPPCLRAAGRSVRNIHRLFLLSVLLLALFSCRRLYMENIEQFEIMGYETILFDDTTWTRSSSPYRIDGNLFIVPEATLTIEPGVTVLLGKDVMIGCHGRIVARGTADRPIRFDSIDDGAWGKIDCFGGRLDEDGRPPSNIFTHCIVENGRGITVRAGAADVRHCMLRNNRSTPLRLEYSAGLIEANAIHDNSTLEDTASGNGAGLMIYTDKHVVVKGNRVYRNASHGGRDGGGGIYAYAYDTGDVLLKENHVYQNTSDRHGGGIVAYDCRVEDNVLTGNTAMDSGGGMYSIRSQIRRNTIENNRSKRGGGVYAENCRITGNRLFHNEAPAGGGGSLFFFGQGRVEQNTFQSRCEQPGNRLETILVSGNPVIHANNILAGAGYGIRVQSHSLGNDLDATGNYWGTRDPARISGMIYDWLSDSTVGLVNWKGYAPSPVSGAPDIADEPCPPPDGISPEPDAERRVQGRVESDRVLTGPPGTGFTVSGNVLVPEGVTLTLSPGIVLTVDPDATFRIRGFLQAAGTRRQPIRVTGDAEKPWDIMLFENRSDQSPSDPAPDQSGLLRHCIVEHGRGIVMEGLGPRIDQCEIRRNAGSGITVRNAAVTISGSRIEANSSPTNGGGVYIYGSRLVHLTDNVIAGNRAGEDGGGVFAYGYRSNTAANLSGNRIEGNTCGGDGGGAWLSRSALTHNRIGGNRSENRGGGVFATFALVEDNIIQDNTAYQGGGIFAEVNSAIQDNAVTGNRATDIYGGGVFMNFWGVSIKNERFIRNRVSGNAAAGETGAGGVYLNGRMDFEDNEIFANHGFQLFNANSAEQPPFTALRCYWGKVDRNAIGSLIFDGQDDPGLSPVVFEPFRTKPFLGKAGKKGSE